MIRCYLFMVCRRGRHPCTAGRNWVVPVSHNDTKERLHLESIWGPRGRPSWLLTYRGASPFDMDVCLCPCLCVCVGVCLSLWTCISALWFCGGRAHHTHDHVRAWLAPLFSVDMGRAEIDIDVFIPMHLRRMTLSLSLSLSLTRRDLRHSRVKENR